MLSKSYIDYRTYIYELKFDEADIRSLISKKERGDVYVIQTNDFRIHQRPHR